MMSAGNGGVKKKKKVLPLGRDGSKIMPRCLTVNEFSLLQMLFMLTPKTYFLSRTVK